MTNFEKIAATFELAKSIYGEMAKYDITIERNGTESNLIEPDYSLLVKASVNAAKAFVDSPEVEDLLKGPYPQTHITPTSLL